METSICCKKRQRGFTLVEIAIVLVIIGVMLASVTGGLGAFRDSAKIKQTSRYLEDARTALETFATLNGYLPCPDSDGDGISEGDADDRPANAAECSASMGALPYLDLGLERQTPWNDIAFYAINTRASAAVCDEADSQPQCYFSDNTPNGITFQTDHENGGLDITDVAGDAVANKVLAIIGSYGKNAGVTAQNCNNAGVRERINCNNVLDAFVADHSQVDFDDQLVWIDVLTFKSLLLSNDSLANNNNGGNGDNGGGDADPNNANQPNNADDVINNCANNDACDYGNKGDWKDNILVGDNKNGSKKDTINGRSGSDQLYGGEDDDKLNGNDGDDLLVGGIGNDQLDGESGADTLYGGEGDDSIDGASGADIVYGGDGNDAIKGGSQNDQLFGGYGDDSIDGESGADTIYGGPGNDQLFGSSGADKIYGGGDDDTIDPGHDNDEVFGDAGNDIYLLTNNGQGNDSFDGGNDDDSVHVSASGFSNNDQVTVQLENGKEYALADGDLDFGSGQSGVIKYWDTILLSFSNVEKFEFK